MNKYFLPIYHSELKPWIKWWILKRLGGGESSLKAITISSGTLTKVDKSKALSIKEYYGNAIQNGTPTPNSPIPVQTISGNITFNINSVNYKLDLKSKQLFDNNSTPTLYLGANCTPINTGIRATVAGSGEWKSSIYVTNINLRNYVGKQFWLHAEPQQASGNNTPYFAIGRSDKTGNTRTSMDTSSTYGKKDLVATIPSIDESDTKEYLCITIAGTGNGSANVGDYIDYLNIMLLYQESYTSYESYYNYELCKIVDYKDKIVNVNGTWKIEKNIGKVVLNGTESWATRSGSTSYAYYVPNVFNMNKAVGLTSHFIFYSGGSTSAQTRECIASANTSKDLALFTNNSSMNTVANLKTWLSNNNVTVYYSLATPTTETITNTNLISELNALYEFYVNSSTVTISNNSEITLEVLLEYYGR